MITVTSKDALRTAQLTPGVKPGKCVSHEQTTAKDASALHKFGIEVVEEGFPVPVPIQDYMISEKAVSMGKAFFIACGFPESEWDKLMKGESTSAQIDEKSCVGKSFNVMVVNEKYENRINNKAVDFFKLV